MARHIGDTGMVAGCLKKCVELLTGCRPVVCWIVGEQGRTLDGGKIYQMYLDEKHVPDPKGDLSSRVNHGVPRQVHSGQVRSANDM